MVSHLVCPPGGWQRTHRYEYSTAPSITLGTLRKLYTALWAKQTNHCWSHYRSPWLNRYPAADERTGTCGCGDRKRKGFLNQNSSGKILVRGSCMAFRHGKVICFVFISFLFPPLGLWCQFRMGSRGQLSSCLVGYLFPVLQTDWKNIERHVIDMGRGDFQLLQQLQEDCFASSFLRNQKNVAFFIYVYKG